MSCATWSTVLWISGKNNSRRCWEWASLLHTGQLRLSWSHGVTHNLWKICPHDVTTRTWAAVNKDDEQIEQSMGHTYWSTAKYLMIDQPNGPSDRSDSLPLLQRWLNRFCKLQYIVLCTWIWINTIGIWSLCRSSIIIASTNSNTGWCITTTLHINGLMACDNHPEQLRASYLQPLSMTKGVTEW